jgi:hypothetical protein
VARHPVLFALPLLLLVAGACDENRTDAEALAEGDSAPSFVLPSASGGKVWLSDFAGEKPVLLYFSMGPG